MFRSRKYLYDPGVLVMWLVSPVLGLMERRQAASMGTTPDLTGADFRAIAAVFPLDEEEMEEVLRYRFLAWLVMTVGSVGPLVISNFLRNFAGVSEDELFIVVLNYSGAALVGFAGTGLLISTARWVLAHFLPWMAAIIRIKDRSLGWLLWWFCVPSVLEFGYAAFIAVAMTEALQGEQTG